MFVMLLSGLQDPFRKVHTMRILFDTEEELEVLFSVWLVT